MNLYKARQGGGTFACGAHHLPGIPLSPGVPLPIVPLQLYRDYMLCYQPFLNLMEHGR